MAAISEKLPLYTLSDISDCPAQSRLSERCALLVLNHPELLDRGIAPPGLYTIPQERVSGLIRKAVEAKALPALYRFLRPSWMTQFDWLDSAADPQLLIEALKALPEDNGVVYATIEADRILPQVLIQTLAEQCPNLQGLTLDLRYACQINVDRFGGQSLNPLKQLADLNHLEFISCQFDQEGLDTICELNLSGLHFTDCYLRGVEPTKLSQLQLQSFGLNKLHGPRGQFDAIFQHLDWTALKSLSFTCMPIGDEGLGFLEQGQALKELTIAACNVHGPGLATLQKLPKLKRLHLSCDPLTDASLSYLSPLCLTELSLRRTQIRGAALRQLKTSRLRKLHLGRLSQLRDIDLAALDLPLLNTLLLYDCCGLTGHFLSELKAPELKELGLNNCSPIEADTLRQLRRFPQLKRLYLSDTEVTDDAVRSIATERLDYLELNRCRELTDAGIRQLAEQPPKHVSLLYANQLSQAAVDSLKQRCAVSFKGSGASCAAHP